MTSRRTNTLFWERFTGGFPIRATAVMLVAALAVVGCGREGAISRSLERIDYDSLPAGAGRPAKPDDRLHAAATELRDLLTIQRRRDLSASQAKAARTARASIELELRALHRQFHSDRSKLERLKAGTALSRLDAIEAKAAPLERALRAALAQVPATGERAAGSAARAAKVLAELSPSKSSQPLSSNLGFGIRNAEPRQVSLSAGITPAYAAPVAADTPSDLPRVPEDADLASMAETAVTPAVHQLAEQLAHDPVKIYDYVRNSIKYEPYYGIRKGADETLVERAGSDADQAALLIALLRDSGIHARFVQGVAELPANTAAAWVGVDVAAGERPEAAPEILWAGGIPTTTIRSNGQLTKVRFMHVWAEAYVSDDAYRGVDEALGGRRWHALDPSVKAVHFTPPATDLHELLDPSVRSWIQELEDDSDIIGEHGVIAPPSAEAEAQTAQLFQDVRQKLEQASGENATVADVLGSRDSAVTHVPYLPSSTPFKALSVSGEYRAVPNVLQASVTLAVSGADPLSAPNPDPDGLDEGFTFTAPTRELATKRVTVTYAPATADDAEIIDAYHGLLNAPTYAAALVPILRVDGHVVARGHRAVSTGYAQNFRITYRSPGLAADSVENPLYVGGISAFSLDVGFASSTRTGQRAAAWQAAGRAITKDNVLTDAIAGEAMSILGHAYFTRNDALNVMLAQAADVHQQRSLSGLLVATDVTPTYLASFPVGAKLTGMVMDVDQDVQAVVGLNDTTGAPSRYMSASGINSSASEGLVFEKAFRQTSVSTAKVMDVAAQQRVPLFAITQDNAANLLPQLTVSQEARAEIAAAVARPGVRVVVPRDTVTIGGWSGSGYIVSNGDATDYRIMGGASGGFTRFLSPSYWAETLGAPEWLQTTLACGTTLWHSLALSRAIWTADMVWALLFVWLEGAIAPLLLTGLGVALVTAIFLILFYKWVVYHATSALEGGETCREGTAG